MSAAVVDPITQEIVGNALASIADEMATTIFRTAHSTVVRDGMDFSAALCDARGEAVTLIDLGFARPPALASVPRGTPAFMAAMVSYPTPALSATREVMAAASEKPALGSASSHCMGVRQPARL